MSTISKKDFAIAPNSVPAFTPAEVELFAEGKLMLAGAQLLRMRSLILLQGNLAAIELLEALEAEPALRKGIDWANPYVDNASGDTIDPFPLNYDAIPEALFNSARTMAVTERTGGTNAREMLEILSFSERMKVGKDLKKDNIMLEVRLSDGTIGTARIPDNRLELLEPLLKNGAKAECSMATDGTRYVESVIAESDESIKQREAEDAKAKAETKEVNENKKQEIALQGVSSMAAKDLSPDAQAQVLAILNKIAGK